MCNEIIRKQKFILNLPFTRKVEGRVTLFKAQVGSIFYRFKQYPRPVLTWQRMTPIVKNFIKCVPTFLK